MPVIKEVTKLWGRELWHHNDARYCMKTLVLEPGAQGSLHWHHQKHETMLCIEGTVAIQVWKQTRTLRPGDAVDIAAGTPHRFAALGGRRAVIIEASTEHDDADVERIEPARYTDGRQTAGTEGHEV